MSNPSTNDNRVLAIGVAGVFALLLIAMGYAYWDSNSYYQPEQIDPTEVGQTIDR